MDDDDAVEQFAERTSRNLVRESLEEACCLDYPHAFLAPASAAAVIGDDESRDQFGDLDLPIPKSLPTFYAPGKLGGFDKRYSIKEWGSAEGSQDHPRPSSIDEPGREVFVASSDDFDDEHRQRLISYSGGDQESGLETGFVPLRQADKRFSVREWSGIHEEHQNADQYRRRLVSTTSSQQESLDDSYQHPVIMEDGVLVASSIDCNDSSLVIGGFFCGVPTVLGAFVAGEEVEAEEIEVEDVEIEGSLASETSTKIVPDEELMEKLFDKSENRFHDDDCASITAGDDREVREITPTGEIFAENDDQIDDEENDCSRKNTVVKKPSAIPVLKTSKTGVSSPKVSQSQNENLLVTENSESPVVTLMPNEEHQELVDQIKTNQVTEELNVIEQKASDGIPLIDDEIIVRNIQNLGNSAQSDAQGSKDGNVALIGHIDEAINAISDALNGFKDDENNKNVSQKSSLASQSAESRRNTVIYVGKKDSTITEQTTDPKSQKSSCQKLPSGQWPQIQSGIDVIGSSPASSRRIIEPVQKSCPTANKVEMSSQPAGDSIAETTTTTKLINPHFEADNELKRIIAEVKSYNDYNQSASAISSINPMNTLVQPVSNNATALSTTSDTSKFMQLPPQLAHTPQDLPSQLKELIKDLQQFASSNGQDVELSVAKQTNSAQTRTVLSNGTLQGTIELVSQSGPQPITDRKDTPRHLAELIVELQQQLSRSPSPQQIELCYTRHTRTTKTEVKNGTDAPEKQQSSIEVQPPDFDQLIAEVQKQFGALGVDPRQNLELSYSKNVKTTKSDDCPVSVTTQIPVHGPGMAGVGQRSFMNVAPGGQTGLSMLLDSVSDHVATFTPTMPSFGYQTQPVNQLPESSTQNASAQQASEVLGQISKLLQGLGLPDAQSKGVAVGGSAGQMREMVHEVHSNAPPGSRSQVSLDELRRITDLAGLTGTSPAVPFVEEAVRRAPQFFGASEHAKIGDSVTTTPKAVLHDCLDNLRRMGQEHSQTSSLPPAIKKPSKLITARKCFLA